MQKWNFILAKYIYDFFKNFESERQLFESERQLFERLHSELNNELHNELLKAKVKI